MVKRLVGLAGLVIINLTLGTKPFPPAVFTLHGHDHEFMAFVNTANALIHQAHRFTLDNMTTMTTGMCNNTTTIMMRMDISL